MPLAEFEKAIPAIERPQTYILDCTATEIGHFVLYFPSSFLSTIQTKL